MLQAGGDLVGLDLGEGLAALQGSVEQRSRLGIKTKTDICLLYTSDAADE